MFKKYTSTLLIGLMLAGACLFVSAANVKAQTPASGGDTSSAGSTETCQTIAKSQGLDPVKSCINEPTQTSNCPEGTDKGCGVVAKYINPAIAFFSAIFGVIVTIMIILGGIQYASAEGDPQKVANAKKRIFNALFALVAFGLLYGILYYLIPGGF